MVSIPIGISFVLFSIICFYLIFRLDNSIHMLYVCPFAALKWNQWLTKTNSNLNLIPNQIKHFKCTLKIFDCVLRFLFCVYSLRAILILILNVETFFLKRDHLTRLNQHILFFKLKQFLKSKAVGALCYSRCR
jgi:hypothetical protein